MLCVARCGHRLSGIHYSSAMKPVFTDKPANVSASEHRRNVTTPNGRPLGCTVLHLNCKRAGQLEMAATATASRVIYVPFLGTARLVVNLRRRQIGEPARRRGWTTSSATFQDVASVRQDFAKSQRILAQRILANR